MANLVTLPLTRAMHKSAFEHPPEVDEFEAAGLAKAPSVVVRPPRVALAPIAFECVLEREFTVGDFNDHVIWGRLCVSTFATTSILKAVVSIRRR